MLESGLVDEPITMSRAADARAIQEMIEEITG